MPIAVKVGQSNLCVGLCAFLYVFCSHAEDKLYLISWMWWTCHWTADRCWSIPGCSAGSEHWSPRWSWGQQRSSLTDCSMTGPDYLYEYIHVQCGQDTSSCKLAVVWTGVAWFRLNLDSRHKCVNFRFTWCQSKKICNVLADLQLKRWLRLSYRIHCKSTTVFIDQIISTNWTKN